MKCMVCEGSGIFKDECCVHCFGYGQVKNWIENIIPSEMMQPSDFVFYSEIKNFMKSSSEKYSEYNVIWLDKEINDFVIWLKKRFLLKNIAIYQDFSFTGKLNLCCRLTLPYKNNYLTFFLSLIGSEVILSGWFDPLNDLGKR